MSCDRCTGHCCRAFTLPFNSETLKERAARLEDGKVIADMVIPLYEGPARDMPLDVRTSVDTEAQRLAGSYDFAPIYVFTCRHFDGTGCKIYARRPSMCSTYPNGRRCAYDGCTWKAAREQRVSGEGKEIPV